VRGVVLDLSADHGGGAPGDDRAEADDERDPRPHAPGDGGERRERGDRIAHRDDVARGEAVDGRVGQDERREHDRARQPPEHDVRHARGMGGQLAPRPPDRRLASLAHPWAQVARGREQAAEDGHGAGEGQQGLRVHLGPAEIPVEQEGQRLGGQADVRRDVIPLGEDELEAEGAHVRGLHRVPDDRGAHQRAGGHRRRADADSQTNRAGQQHRERDRAHQEGRQPGRQEQPVGGQTHRRRRGQPDRQQDVHRPAADLPAAIRPEDQEQAEQAGVEVGPRVDAPRELEHEEAGAGAREQEAGHRSRPAPRRLHGRPGDHADPEQRDEPGRHLPDVAMSGKSAGQVLEPQGRVPGEVPQRDVCVRAA
jgi:hypothetical protein